MSAQSTRSACWLVVVVLVCVLGPQGSLAQEVGGDDADREVEIPSVPAMPTASALRLDPSKFVHPSDPRELGVQLLNGYDVDNRAYEPGTALEIAPVWLVVGESTTLDGWQDSYARRLASRTFVSGAVTGNSPGASGAGEGDSSAFLGASLKTVLANTRDPRWDDELATCVKEALGATRPEPGDSKAERLADRARRDEKIRVCKEAFRERISRETGHRLSFAASYLANGASTARADLRAERVVSWLTYSWGTQRASRSDAWLQGLAGAKYVAGVDTGPAVHETHGAVGISGGVSRLDFELRGAWMPTVAGTDDWRAAAFAAGGLLQLHATDRMSVGVDLGSTFGGDVGESWTRGYLLVSFGGAVQKMAL